MTKERIDVVKCDVEGCDTMWKLDDEKSGDRCYVCRRDFCKRHELLIDAEIKTVTANIMVRVPSICPMCGEQLNKLIGEESYELTRRLRDVVYKVVRDDLIRLGEDHGKAEDEQGDSGRSGDV